MITASRSPLSAELSCSAFASLYLFRKVHAYRLHDQPLPHIPGRAHDGAELVIPLFDLYAAPHDTIRDILGAKAWLYPFSETEAAGRAENFESSWTDADSDYSFGADHLRSFEALKKRGQDLKQFEANHAEQVNIHPLGNHPRPVRPARRNRR